MTECDESIIFMNNVSTKETKTIAKNVMSTASIRCHSKKVSDCYILKTSISNQITIANYYYYLLLC